MDKSKQEKRNRLETIMCEKIDLIAELLSEGRNKYAKIEIRALKAYLNCQLSLAKKQAKINQKESLNEEVESE